MRVPAQKPRKGPARICFLGEAPGTDELDKGRARRESRRSKAYPHYLTLARALHPELPWTGDWRKDYGVAEHLPPYPLVGASGDVFCPALRQANIGVAMGEGSSDVARELADVVLTCNDFDAMVAAVEQGRTIFANIRRSLRFLVTSNISELIVAAATMIGGLVFPFRPIQILWLNLVSDVFPALALVLEPADRRIMRQPPRPPAELPPEEPAPETDEAPAPEFSPDEMDPTKPVPREPAPAGPPPPTQQAPPAAPPPAPSPVSPTPPVVKPLPRPDGTGK